MQHSSLIMRRQAIVKPFATLAQLIGLIALVLTTTVAGCGSPSTSNPTPNPTPSTAAVTRAVPTPTPTSTPALDLSKIRPNELGKVLILEYHRIGLEELRWTRSEVNFRHDLELFYAKGYRLISLSDFINNKINLPAGYSPLILTFDDSSDSQFRYIKSGGELKIDPHCALGILEDFSSQHPDFGLKATWYVLPAAAPPNDLFDQPEYARQKLQYLVQRGMEIGNHTYWHQPLGQVSDQEVQKQLALAVKATQEAVPGYQVLSLALPLGEYPKNKNLAIHGSYKGVEYNHKAIVLVGAEPAPAPNRKDYAPYALPRVQAIQSELDHWLSYLDQNPLERYVSDGDPDRITFPTALNDKYNSAATLREVPAPGPGYRTILLR
ncbi:MAG: polysaccharide deacetylase family protein [Chloroflexi bacterium]|nr:polysaccharide deacetylase family protein [Chloroflexota bacterium]